MTWQGPGQNDSPKQVYGPCSQLSQPFLAFVQEAAEQERQKAQAAAAAERAAFEAQEARMAAELEQRTQQERKLLQEAAQRAREAAEQRRRCPLQCMHCLDPLVARCIESSQDTCSIGSAHTQQERKLLQAAAQHARKAAEQRRSCLPVRRALFESVTQHPAFNAIVCDQRDNQGRRRQLLFEIYLASWTKFK